MDVAISMAVGLTVIAVMLAIAYGLLCDLRRVTAQTDRERQEARYYQSQARLAEELPWLSGYVAGGFAQIDEYRAGTDGR